MVSSPFDESAQRYTELANNLINSRDYLSSVEVQGSGATVTALNEHIGNISKVLGTLSEHAGRTSSISKEQVPIDERLLSAPGPHDVDTAKANLDHVRQELMRHQRFSPPSFSEIRQLGLAQDAYNDTKSQRDAAYLEHQGGTSGRTFVPPESSDISAFDRRHTPNIPDYRGSSSGDQNGYGGNEGGVGGLEGDMPDDSSSANTHLSGNDGPSAAPAAMMSPQPTGGQPGGGQPMGGAPQMPQIPPMSPSAFKDTPKGKDLPDYDLSDTAVGTSTSGDSGGASGTGSSVSGVTTRADVTGTPSGAVASSGGVRGGDAPQGPMMRGGMGGMPMGGMGSGGGNSNSKERPEIFTEDKDLLGTETAEAGVEGGLIGRSTSAPPG